MEKLKERILDTLIDTEGMLLWDQVDAIVQALGLTLVDGSDTHNPENDDYVRYMTTDFANF